MRAQRVISVVAVCAVAAGLALAAVRCGGNTGGPAGDGGGGGGDGPKPPPPACTGGTDADGDGYGKGCPAGPDCDDSSAAINPGAKEVCDGKDNNCDGKVDEGVKNACGTCDPGCGSLGKSGPFPVDKSKDSKLKDADGVGLDPNGDLVLDRKIKQENYLWIANTFDTLGSAGGCAYAISSGYDTKKDPFCRGTVSKVDTVGMKEVARYFTTTCNSKPGTATSCLDVNGKPIVKSFPHAPSRTAVDYNFDVWVANRAFGGQPSATKIANDPADCIDRNKNGKIETSKDQNADGKISVDCDGDGKPDGAATVCKGALAGKPPEFLGDDDECILFTTNYAEPKEMGRSICLDAGKANVGASDAWVGTWNRPGNNRYFKINGTTGAIEATVELPPGHTSYGCTSDGRHVIWSTFGGGTLAYFSSLAPYEVGPALVASPKVSKNPGATAWHYGIATNGDAHIWLGGSNSCRALRYKPDRTSFSTLGKGKWTLFHVPCPTDTGSGYTTTRGVAPDNRGKVWMALTSGFIVRIDQSLPDGEHDLTKGKDIWATGAEGVIGAGVDMNGHVWGIGHSNSLASRLDVDAKGNVTATKTKDVAVGFNPYTYSDFTGYGLMNFVRPQGRYVYQMQPCPSGQRARWKQVLWKATTPAGTSVVVRARAGDSETTMGSWTPAASASPAPLESAKPPLAPNPAFILEVEFTLKTTVDTATPILHDFDVTFDCTPVPA
jgi:hypothetical protein